MRNTIKILFILFFSVVSHHSFGNSQPENFSFISVTQQEESEKKEFHSIDSHTIINNNLSRNNTIPVFTAKTKVARTFFGIQFLKTITKKNENKSVLAKNHFSYCIIPIRFKQTDIIFPFHNFW